MSDGVLVVVTDYDGQGGLQRGVRELVARLSRGHAVTVVTWSSDRRRCGPGRSLDEPRVMRIPALASWSRDHPSLLAAINTAFSMATGVAAAVSTRRRWKVAYAAGLHPDGTVAALAGRMLGRPYVVDTWLPGPIGNVARLEHSVARAPLKRLLAGARAVVAGTEEIAEELAGCGLPPERITLQGKGVDMNRFSPVGEGPRAEARRALGLRAGESMLAYCGRLDLRQKRLDLLMEGWRRAAPRPWRLVVAGEGPDRAEVVRMAEGIDPPPLFLGWQEDVTPVLRAADAFTLPTNYEATGLALAEGMASGLAGLVSRTTTYERLRPGGVMLVTNEAGAWAEAITAITGDVRHREALGRAGRRWAERFYDAERSFEAMERLLGS